MFRLGHWAEARVAGVEGAECRRCKKRRAAAFVPCEVRSDLQFINPKVGRTEDSLQGLGQGVHCGGVGNLWRQAERHKSCPGGSHGYELNTGDPWWTSFRWGSMSTNHLGRHSSLDFIAICSTLPFEGFKWPIISSVVAGARFTLFSLKGNQKGTRLEGHGKPRGRFGGFQSPLDLASFSELRKMNSVPDFLHSFSEVLVVHKKF